MRPLVRKRVVWFPTFLGWLVLAVVTVLGAMGGVRSIHPFLAQWNPVRGEILVVEGWIPDRAVSFALDQFERYPYRLVVTVGAPFEVGAVLSRYHTNAEMTAHRMVAMGLDPSCVIAVPAPYAPRDRTYNAALAFRRWLEKTGWRVRGIDIVSLSVHTRRTRLAFQQVLGDEIRVGALAAPCDFYDEARWWATSAGVRMVLAEGIAYVYARLFGHPPESPAEAEPVRAIRVGATGDGSSGPEAGETADGLSQCRRGHRRGNSGGSTDS